MTTFQRLFLLGFGRAVGILLAIFMFCVGYFLCKIFLNLPQTVTVGVAVVFALAGPIEVRDKSA